VAKINIAGNGGNMSIPFRLLILRVNYLARIIKDKIGYEKRN